ncbi:MAG: DUF4301 family protein [Bacteroidota bacterium]
MFTDKDIQQLQEKGISQEAVQEQLNYFHEGFPFTNVTRAASIGNGILQLSEDSLDYYTTFYDRLSNDKVVCKFVPASGAASRMFKAIFAYVDSEDSIDSHPKAKQIIEQLDQLAFKNDLATVLQKEGKSLENLLNKKQYKTILAALLKTPGLDYGNLPKGLLQFHDYEEFTRTPMEEHLVEGAHYCKGADKVVDLHFTVSPEHQAKFESLLADKQKHYEDQFEVSYEIGFSQQQPHTDTIAVDMNNQPFRLKDSSILFRPGGHGALIENLNALDADLIFIKNIDNVVPDHLKAETYRYKKAIGGVLLEIQTKVFDYLKQLDEEITADLVEEIENFIKRELFIELPESYASKNLAEKSQLLHQKLNRPIRICGMVKNEGEPGGGPFFATNPDGSASLHIVESAQFDAENEQQIKLLKSSSHFNPVDLVCTLKNYQGEPFDLTKYVNHQQGFIAQKSKAGKQLKALERPGLWNGSMADWNTVFVEVPIITFNPVKEVNDLLRDTHQQQ